MFLIIAPITSSGYVMPCVCALCVFLLYPGTILTLASRACKAISAHYVQVEQSYM